MIEDVTLRADLNALVSALQAALPELLSSSSLPSLLSAPSQQYVILTNLLRLWLTSTEQRRGDGVVAIVVALHRLMQATSMAPSAAMLNALYAAIPSNTENSVLLQPSTMPLSSRQILRREYLYAHPHRKVDFYSASLQAKLLLRPQLSSSESNESHRLVTLLQLVISKPVVMNALDSFFESMVSSATLPSFEIIQFYSWILSSCPLYFNCTEEGGGVISSELRNQLLQVVALAYPRGPSSYLTKLSLALGQIISSLTSTGGMEMMAVWNAASWDRVGNQYNHNGLEMREIYLSMWHLFANTLCFALTAVDDEDIHNEQVVPPLTSPLYLLLY